MKNFSSFAATPECPNVGPAPAGVVQPTAPTEAANTTAKSHAHEATKLWEQPPSLIWTASSNGEPPSSSGCSAAIPLPTKLWYKSRNPTRFYQPVFTTGSKSWGSLGQPQQHGEQRHGREHGRTVWHWNQSSDAAECLPVPRIRYEHPNQHCCFHKCCTQVSFYVFQFSDIEAKEERHMGVRRSTLQTHLLPINAWMIWGFYLCLIAKMIKLEDP